MQSVTFLTEHRGEIRSTRHDLVEVWSEEKHAELLEETKTALISHDMHAPVSIPRYGKSKIQIPAWMKPEQYIKERINWKYYIGLGADPGWPENYFHKLKSLDEVSRYAAIKLLQTKNFRSEFRQSLRNQLENWLQDENPEHASPFSRRQWECLLNRYTVREAKQICKKLYWSNR